MDVKARFALHIGHPVFMRRNIKVIFEGSGQSLLRLEAISFCQIEYRLVTFLQLLRDFRHLTAADVLA